jgi:6-phosphogluconolactonase
VSGQLRGFADSRRLFEAAADLVAERAARAVRAAGTFSLVLSGGNTPGSLYARLAEPPFASGIPWAQVRVYWGDERFVPFSHPQSNFRLAQDALLSRVPVLEGHVYPMPADGVTPERAALAYEDTLGALAAAQGRSPGRSPPRFDLVLLGLGADGHTASLFPGGPECAEQGRWCIASRAPEGTAVRERLTLTLPVLNAARSVLFLVSGAQKRAILQRVLHPARGEERLYPAQLVRPAGELLWFTDIPLNG